MCELCLAHERQVGQFQRALNQPLDQLSASRIQLALNELQEGWPICANLSFNTELAPIFDLQLRRIDKVLGALSIADVRELLREIETELLKPKK